jgi:hypothetical protein
MAQTQKLIKFKISLLLKLWNKDYLYEFRYETYLFRQFAIILFGAELRS